MNNLKVNNVIIGKQFENNENLKEFLEIVQEKEINIVLIETQSKVNIEKDLYFEFFWPISSQAISENSINNNALVCKLCYKNFACLFTGDIEEEAERILISKYKGTDKLKANILKVAHHGSKSSSTEEFLKLVQPQIALVGVGKNNMYGHPSDEVIERLENIRC